jgi:hypothetical protein
VHFEERGDGDLVSGDVAPAERGEGEAACGHAGEAVVGFGWAPPRRGEREEREGGEIFGEGEQQAL